MEDFKGKIVGGIVMVVLGGTTFAVSQTDIVDNFADETGMSQEQAQLYIEETQDNLESFDKIASDLIESGTSSQDAAASIDCLNYVYPWETSSLTCSHGKLQIEQIGLREVSLGNCFNSLGTNLENLAAHRINECMSHIDELNASYDQEIMSALYTPTEVTDAKNANIYNKSVLKAALDSHK